MPDGTPGALILTPLKARKLYREGDAFEYFKVLRIDADAGTVVIYSEKDEKEHVYPVSGETSGR